MSATDAMLRAHALIVTRAARAMIEAMGLHACNQQRAACGNSMAYDEAAFLSAITINAIGENDVLTTLEEATRS